MPPQETAARANTIEGTIIQQLQTEFQQLDRHFKERRNTPLGRIWGRDSQQISKELSALKSGPVEERFRGTYIDGVQAKLSDWAEVSKLGSRAPAARPGIQLPPLTGPAVQQYLQQGSTPFGAVPVIGPQDLTGYQVWQTLGQLQELSSNPENFNRMKSLIDKAREEMQKNAEAFQQSLEKPQAASGVGAGQNGSVLPRSRTGLTLELGRLRNGGTMGYVNLLSAGVAVDKGKAELRLSSFNAPGKSHSLGDVVHVAAEEGEAVNGRQRFIVTAKTGSGQEHVFSAVVGGVTTKVR